MMITVAGSAILAYFMNDAFVSDAVSSISTSDVSTKSIQLLAYDTRDSSNLLQMGVLDNSNTASNNVLCGVTCKDNLNKIPSNTGTEFIVLRIKNNSIDPIFLGQVIVNNVGHSWDPNTKDVELDGTSDDVSGVGKYPSDGMFSVIPSDSSLLHQRKNEIKNGEIANIIIKLGPDDSDINLNDGLRILLDIGTVQFVEFVIESGDAK
ncbi:MAG: hypothetical protein GWN01_09600 [Nitrosopumilaceae archaeon]|nr:hypothetical protein [Nitrosopumilaceae archaeon]NIU01159.1 hypothetical protein [Nitrosopumilaceae archaeon]NIU87528.1 hypothetical protein [Nitrosopumilaceae archaeon]NIV65993.1 hypothetical protein [Nitrosopumilaceae archaeon]NIX61761.1 hypothetical protein [Nitrosopumilaceae archaeon]